MAKQKTVSDEIVVSALMCTATMKEAAELAGLSTRALYDRMSDGEFKGLYAAAKADLLRQTSKSLNNRLEAAINTIAGIMDDESNNAAVRLQAAQTILNNAAKFADRLQTIEIEQSRQQEANNCGFTFWK